MKDYEVLDELIPKTQELHRAIFDKGYEQGFKDGANSEYEHDHKVVKAYNDGQAFILDRIRAEVMAIVINGQIDEHTLFIRTGEQVKQMVLDIIDKCRGE